jgi:hypothetical protein
MDLVSDLLAESSPPDGERGEALAMAKAAKAAKPRAVAGFARGESVAKDGENMANTEGEAANFATFRQPFASHEPSNYKAFRRIRRFRQSQTAKTGDESRSPPLRRYRVTVEQDGEQRIFTMLSPAEHGAEEAKAAACFHFGERLVAISEVSS